MSTSSNSSTPKYSGAEFRRTVLCLAAGLAALFAASLCLGASSVSAGDVLRWLTGQLADDRTRAILTYLRLPRSLACLFCGGALAAAGLLLQSALGNSLASPGTVGVNAGAGFCAVAAAYLFPYSAAARTAGVLVGALAVVLLVWGMAGHTGASRLTVILAGVAISSLMTAATDTIVTLRPEVLTDRSAFSIGGFASVDSAALLAALPYGILGTLGAGILAPRLNLLLLGDETAASLGLPVGLCRLGALLCAAALAAGAVSVCGLLGFVGLMTPHLMRRFTRDIRRLLPLCILGGSTLVLLCDILARVLFAPYELPVGILLSALGAPFFLSIILRRRKGDIHALS